MAELTLGATLDELERVITFVDTELEAHNCPMKAQIQIDIAVEEIYVNIAHYAYNPEVGPATICVKVGGEPLQVTITFVDKGVQYDPIKKADPDISKNAEEREIGGLGIFMVKKSMDEIKYEYVDGCNILTIIKHI
ncbi:MAG: ATP-binding protein [Clostridia bacterium]